MRRGKECGQCVHDVYFLYFKQACAFYDSGTKGGRYSTWARAAPEG